MNLPHRLLALTLFGLSLTAFPLRAQFSDCPTDFPLVTNLPPNGNYAVPVSDGAGGALFRFYAGEFNQLEGRAWVQRMSADGYRMWGDNGRVAAQSAANQFAAASHADGKGGCYISWTENRFNGPYQNRFAQHFDAAGQALWEFGGKYLGEALTPYADESACTLSDGSMAIALNGNDNDAVFYFQVRRYLPDGTATWTVQLDTLSTGFSPRLVSDEAGGVFVSWQINGDLHLQHIDSQGKTWAAPKLFTQAAYYWCYSKPNGVFVGYTNEVPTGGYEFTFQRYDLSGAAQYPLPGKKAPYIGLLSALTPAQSGGFFMEHQSHISRIGPNGSLLWQTTLPNGINQGQFSILVEPVTDTLVATYSANGMIAFDAQGQVMWTKAGNPLLGDPFGLTGACATTDKRFITTQYGTQLYSYKWNLDGTPYNVIDWPTYTLAAPDSVYIGRDTVAIISPDSLATNIETWLISTDSLNFQPVSNSAQRDTLRLTLLLQNTWLKAVLRRGNTCFDTIGPQKIVVVPLSSLRETYTTESLWRVWQNGSVLLLSALHEGSASAPLISLYAMDGRMVFSEKTTEAAPDGTYSVSLPALCTGVYAYRVWSREGIQTGKVWVKE